MRPGYALLLILLVPIQPVFAGSYDYEMSWGYENRGSLPYELSLKDLGVPVFSNTSYQDIRMVLSYPEYEEIELNDGFLKAVPVVKVSLEPGDEYIVEARFRFTTYPKDRPALRSEDAQGMTGIPEGMGPYLESSPLYTWDNPDIFNLAGNLMSGEETVIGKTLKIVEWFSEYSTYTVNELPKRPWATVRDPRGDCDDLGLLFVSMCRSQGIPAYLQGGLVFGESIDLDESDWDGHYRYVFKGVGWHAWAMVYIPPWGWLPVDLTMIDGLRPVDAINEAYYWRDSTVVMWNITSHDYVQDEVDQRDALTENQVYWTQRDTHIINEKENQSGYLFIGVLPVLALIIYMVWNRISAGD